MHVLQCIAFTALAVASPVARRDSNPLASIVSSLESLLGSGVVDSGPFAPVTSQIIQDYIEPVQVSMRSSSTR